MVKDFGWRLHLTFDHGASQPGNIADGCNAYHFRYSKTFATEPARPISGHFNSAILLAGNGFRAGQRSATKLRFETEHMIRLFNVEKFFSHGVSKTFVLRRIDAEIKEGEFVSIMGPSGAGKSTLLHILGMHDTNWTGEFYFLEQPVHKLDKNKRADLRNANIGFVFQSYHLLDDLTVYENLEIPLSYRNIKKGERQSIVCDTLDRFAIVGKKDLFPNQLSGGQQQLVAVARAIIAKPKVILADEPTGNLHSSQGEEIMELFRRLNDAGTTIIQVTHSEKNASYGHRIIQLKDGWIEK
jgi:ABC-type lipoprotein export system ATPase subunit